MMDLRPDGEQLEAKKSWFLFDDVAVALGTGIRSTAPGQTVETIVENRRISGNPAFKIASGRKWTFLEGAGGYLFLNGESWKSARVDRQGSWSEISAGGSRATVSRRYQTIWFNHGVAPGGASYAYALLPAKTEDEVAVYAAAPRFRIVENSEEAQAVEEPGRGIRAVNFWTDRPEDLRRDSSTGWRPCWRWRAAALSKSRPPIRPRPIRA